MIIIFSWLKFAFRCRRIENEFHPLETDASNILSSLTVTKNKKVVRAEVKVPIDSASRSAITAKFRNAEEDGTLENVSITSNSSSKSRVSKSLADQQSATSSNLRKNDGLWNQIAKQRLFLIF